MEIDLQRLGNVQRTRSLTHGKVRVGFSLSLSLSLGRSAEPHRHVVGKAILRRLFCRAKLYGCCASPMLVRPCLWLLLAIAAPLGLSLSPSTRASPTLGRRSFLAVPGVLGVSQAALADDNKKCLSGCTAE